MKHVYTHLDGTTISTRESDKNLDFVVVVKTPVEMRRQIQNLIDEVDYLALDQIDRALSDGTVTERDGITYVGGLPHPSIESLQRSYDALFQHVKDMKIQRESLTDLYQAVGWFEGIQEAYWLQNSLREQYVDDGWPREVYVDFTDTIEDVPF